MINLVKNKEEKLPMFVMKKSKLLLVEKHLRNFEMKMDYYINNTTFISPIINL